MNNRHQPSGAFASAPGPVTQLLARVSAGDEDAIDRIFPLVYQQLRQAAEAALRSERPGHTLQPMVVAIEKAQGRGIAYHRQ